MQGLYALKPWYSRRLGRIVRFAVDRGISPDVFTLLGIAGALLAACCVALGWWLPAILMLAVRLGGANLDGAVARARGVSRPWGFVLNEIGDRCSDLIVFGGLFALAARSDGMASTPAVLVATAAVAATLPTTASLAAAGAGATRRNGGPFGKTERCLAMVVATAFPGVLGWVCAVILAGSLLTATVRLWAAHRELAEQVAG
ncbi:CDP-alcohol phosphatidyltransferase family protein [Flexivirga oryzae]|uniref:CDP-diacylglycerol--glycerol-3-phosphate 3-phosphatidyltransferase n=1 Tax=Flexivirga oryzae TaxID=1794944 RepID=A0A839NB65_9MICO|nr:CDP-diacylglycerol--glycerol-3-phosphate 3-phosphatidyltransferase [Flexivirga oryzae]